jgi:hypothetical protein
MKCLQGRNVLWLMSRMLSKERSTVERYVSFEVFTAVTMKIDVFWDVRSCGFRKS